MSVRGVLAIFLRFLNTSTVYQEAGLPRAILSSQIMTSAVQAVETVYRTPESTSGTLTSWIPLTTRYTGHDSQCSTKFWQVNSDADFVAWDPGFGISIQDLRCVPEAATTVWDQDRLGNNTDTVVSIGPITCPEAFSPVATSVIDESRTQIACCPLEYTFNGWRSPGTPGQCYSDVVSGDMLTVYTNDTGPSWIPVTRQIISSTTVIGAHINGWIFAEQTSTPAAPTAAEPTPSVSSSGRNTNSAIVFGIGVALTVVSIIVLAAAIVIIRGSRKTLRVVQSAVSVPNRRLTLPQEPSQYRSMYQTRPSNGGLFLPVPARTRHNAPQPRDKEVHELDGSQPTH